MRAICSAHRIFNLDMLIQFDEQYKLLPSLATNSFIVCPTHTNYMYDASPQAFYSETTWET
jgi:hypothetical protein